MRQLFLTGLLLISLSLFKDACAQEFDYLDEPLLDLLTDLEKSTPYRFLYREPLVEDINVNFSADAEDLFEKLEQVLNLNSIGIRVDSARHQVLIFEQKPESAEQIAAISGFVVDHQTGERLPYATITWTEKGTRKGITANQSGTFSLNRNFEDNRNFLHVSYVGYQEETLYLDLNEKQNWTAITVRLEPELFSSPEIIVNGVTYFNPADTVFTGLMEIGNFSPLGEDNSVRALQTLPAVNVTNALNEGINIRGSSVDGFNVLLDGVSVYNHSHLFGLVDSFNPDVLQNRGFFL